MKKVAAKPQKNRSRLFVIVGTSVILLLAASTASFALYHHAHRSTPSKNTSGIRPMNTTDYSAATPQEKAASDARKSSSTPSTTLNNGPDAVTNTTFSVQIVSANVNSDNVHVGTLVSGVTSGSCSLIAEQSGQQSITLGSASVRQDVNSYDCGVFNIPTSQFPTHGSWKLTLTVTSDRESATNSTNVTIPS